MVHNRRNIKNSIIIAALIISISASPIFATNIEVEIEHNDNEYFHAYNSNTNVVNSLIDSGAAVFSKAFNYMAQNIAKTTSTSYAIHTVLSNVYTRLGSMNTSLTNIATDVGLIKQSNISQTSSLSSILADADAFLPYLSTISTTLGGSTSGNLVDIKNSLQNINWDYTVNGDVIDANLNVITSTTVINASDTYYFRYYFNDLPELSLIKVSLPISPNNRVGNDWRFEFYDMNRVNTISRLNDPKYIYTYNNATQSLELYITNYYWNFNNLLIKVIPSNTSYVYYSYYVNKLYGLSSNNPDFYDVSQYLFSNLQYKELLNISNQGITADFDDSGIIDAINNLSLQDNDVKLNLTINNNTGNDGTNIITRLQNFFDTGVSVSDFFNNVDDAESGWFTQSNSDIINTLSGGYTDFYE